MNALPQMRALQMTSPPSQEPSSVTGLPGRRALDAALMLRVQTSQDRGAFAELASHYAPRLKGWLINRGLNGATAEDVIQDVLVKTWQKANMFVPEKASFSTWVYRLTRNQWIDHRRKHDRLQPTAPDVLQDLVDGPTNSVDEEYDQAEAAFAVHEALAELPPETKNMLHMSFFEGLSHGQIAVRTGLPLGTVKSRIRAPLKRLQDRLSQFRGVVK